MIHSGDLGFYDSDSYARLSDREARLLVIHSDLSKEEQARILELRPDDRRAAAKELRLAGEFQEYLDGDKAFPVPVYAVWGNHEDRKVVERLVQDEQHVPHLHLIHPSQAFQVGQVLIYGVGGNYLPSAKLMDRPIAGGGGKIWSTLSQYVDLVKTVESYAGWQGLRLLVTHVSPGKEPFVEFIGARTRADYTVSGHMGAPYGMVWNPFAIHSVAEAARRLQSGFEAARTACLAATGPSAEEVKASLDFIGRLPEDTVHLGRGVKAPRWYRGMTHVNLPDAHVGYAIMDIEDGRVKISTG